MSLHQRKFNNNDLIAILALSKDATAIYTTEDLVIEMANDAMISFWGKDRSVVGQTFPEAVPELIGQPFFDLLKEVWHTGNTYEAKDTAAQLMVDGNLQWFYYDFIYRALKDENGEVYCILHTATDVSELHNNRLLMLEGKEREQSLTEELTASNEELAAINEELVQSQASLLNINTDLEERVAARVTELSESEQQKQQIINMLPASVVVIRGQELIVEMINQSNLGYWNKTKEEVIGKPFLEILPDLAEQPFAGQLRQVMATGQIVDVKESPVLFQNENDTTRETFVDYTYQPLTDINGNRTGVLVMSFEVTERVAARKLLEIYTEEIQAINEELVAANEELRATNEELINMQLAFQQETQNKQIANEGLQASEQNIRNMISQAPIGMCILEGNPLYVKEVNDAFLEIIGKTHEEIKLKPYWEILPEAAAFYKPITDQVIATGQTYHAREHEVVLLKYGKPETVFVDFVYEPMKDADGKTFAIMFVVIDITEKVLSRKKVEQAEESLRNAIDAAGLGTYSINTTDRIFETSARSKEFFGFEPNEEVPYESAINQIHPDYRKRVTELVEAAITNGERYDSEYPVIGHNDGKARWVRGVGSLQHYNGKDFFTGVLHDITEQKADEQRKNDFIGMVSHELKTPLTSLNAYLQTMRLKSTKTGDAFTQGALNQSLKQVKRMTTMINGFLNVSRLESGKIHIDKERFDMAVLVKESEAETLPMYTSHEIIFKPVEETFVFADRDKIMQVINNLISNAVKYSKTGTTIQVACLTVKGSAQVSVTDQGTGIEAKELNRIFERYYRIENNNHISGFGIGLYLSAEIIGQHNGRIWAESEIGKGSTFYFSLPTL